MEHYISKKIPKAGENADAQDSHVQAVAERSQDRFLDMVCLLYTSPSPRDTR